MTTENEINNPKMKYDKNFGDNRICKCGHTYYRHFDSYDNMAPVGCKYCGCREFVEDQRLVNKEVLIHCIKRNLDENNTSCAECKKQNVCNAKYMSELAALNLEIIEKEDKLKKSLENLKYNFESEMETYDERTKNSYDFNDRNKFRARAQAFDDAMQMLEKVIGEFNG